MIALVMLAAGVPVCAEIYIDNIDVDIEKSSVTVSGRSDEANTGILITAAGDKADEDGFFDALGYQDMTAADENGSFKLSFKMKKADVYRLTAASADENAKECFAYTNKAEAAAAIAEINSSEALSDDLKANQYRLGLCIVGIDSEPNWQALADRIEKLAPLSSADAEETVLTLRRQLLLQYIADKKVDNIFEFNEYLDIFSGKNSVFKDILKEANEKHATGLISGKNFSDYSKFVDGITEAMIIAVVKQPDGYGNVKSVLEAFEDLIGIKTSGASDKVYKDLCEYNAKDLSDLKNRFDELKGSGKTSGGGGGGSGSGNRSGSLAGGKVEYKSEVAAQEDVFNDLENYPWAKESIEKLAALKIVSGRGNGSFAPSDNVTRSEFIKMTVLALNIQASGKEPDFADVSVNNWDYGYIKTAYSAGIITGISNTYFGAGENISRQDMAVIISRALRSAGKEPGGVSDEKFADDSAISDYSRESVYALRKAGIMQGDSNGFFNPLKPANRAEAAKVIRSLLN